MNRDFSKFLASLLICVPCISPAADSDVARNSLPEGKHESAITPNAPGQETNTKIDSVSPQSVPYPTVDVTCHPKYPKESGEREETGVLVVEFTIDVDDTVVEQRILKSTGHKALDEGTRIQLAKCKFHAARVNGEPIKAKFTMTYIWKLDDRN